MAIKSFADTSAVSLAYAFSDAADAAEVLSTELNLIPYTTEGFTMAKEAKTSQAISGSRRSKGSKNTKGTASGAFTIEFGATPFCMDMLQALLMNTWEQDGVSQVITDSDLKQFMVVEKTIRPNVGEFEKQSHERYYGTLINDATLELGDGELITLAASTMSANADYTEELQGADGAGGSLVPVKVVPVDYEIADASNNLKNIVITDDLGNPLEMTFSTASLQIENNVREQAGIGHVFAAGMGMGKVGVNMSGEVYYFDQTVLDAHMRNQRIKGEMVLETREGKFEIYLPNMMAQSPSSNAGGENQDYTTSITLTAEEGEHEGKTCCIFIRFTPADISGLLATISLDSATIDNSTETVSISGATTNAADGSVVTVSISDGVDTINVPGVEVASNFFNVSSVDVSTLLEGSLEITVSISDNDGGVVSGTSTVTKVALAEIDVIFTVDSLAKTATVSGTATNTIDGVVVDVEITDEGAGSVVVPNVEITSGSFSVTGVDISSLAPGMLTVMASIPDNDGDIAVAMESEQLIGLGTITAELSLVLGEATISGVTQYIPDGTVVSVTLEDEAFDDLVVTDVIVTGNAYNAVVADIDPLIQGVITLTVEVDDNLGGIATDTATATYTL